jgi:hypothetical protein
LRWPYLQRVQKHKVPLDTNVSSREASNSVREVFCQANPTVRYRCPKVCGPLAEDPGSGTSLSRQYAVCRWGSSSLAREHSRKQAYMHCATWDKSNSQSIPMVKLHTLPSPRCHQRKLAPEVHLGYHLRYRGLRASKDNRNQPLQSSWEASLRCWSNGLGWNLLLGISPILDISNDIVHRLGRKLGFESDGHQRNSRGLKVLDL